MNSYRVDVQTPMGPRQHIVKAESEEEARDRVKGRMYAKLNVDVEAVHVRSRERADTSDIDYSAEISTVLSRHPGLSASYIAEHYLSATRATLLKYLQIMEARGLVSHEARVRRGQETKYWTLAGQEAA